MKCHYTLDPKTKRKVFIPMCYSTIHSDDINDCTCPDPLTDHQFEKKRFNEVIKQKNETIKCLTSEIEHLRKILNI